MNNNILKIVVVLLASAYVQTVYAANGQPFQQLQQQIDDLQGQVTALQEQISGMQGAITVTVNCASESITNVLNTYKVNPGPLTINVNGTCVENVVINRNNVTIIGGTLKAQSTSVPAFLVEGYTGIMVNGTNIVSAIYPNIPGPLVGGGLGVEIALNATVQMTSVAIASFDQGVSVNEEGVLNIDNSSITNTGNGMLVARSAIARFANMQMTNNGIGLEAREQGRLHLGSTNITTSISGGTTGILLRRGGTGRFNSGTLNVQNYNRGVRIQGHGLLEGGGGVTISNNVRGVECIGAFIISRETLNEAGAFLATAQVINNSAGNVTACSL